jgi:uncharacterized protein YecT (DUF1311 family)
MTAKLAEARGFRIRSIRFGARAMTGGRFLIVLLTWAAASAAAANTQVAPAAAPALLRCVDGIATRLTPTYVDCRAHAHGTRAMLHCIHDERDRQDAVLSKAFDDKVALFDTLDATRFGRGEPPWQSYRDPWCPAHAGANWGTLSAVVSSTFLLDETIRHTINVEQYPRDPRIVPCT